MLGDIVKKGTDRAKPGGVSFPGGVRVRVNFYGRDRDGDRNCHLIKGKLGTAQRIGQFYGQVWR